jgi:hypothetical protein
VLIPVQYWVPKSIIIDEVYVPRWFSDKTFTRVQSWLCERYLGRHDV